MTETSSAVERGSQELNTEVRIARVSREREMCTGRVMFNDLVIFSSRAGLLERVRFQYQVRTFIK